MYTAQVIRKEISNGTLVVYVEFSDGEQKFVKELRTDTIQKSDWVAQICTFELDRLNELDAYKNSIQYGVVQKYVPVKITEPAIDPATLEGTGA